MLSAEVLERTRITVGRSVPEWADLLCLTEKEYEAGLQDPKRITPRQLEELAAYLEVSIEALEAGALDYDALGKHFSGNLGYLPEKYAQGAFSRRRTSSHLLDYLELHYGWRYRHQLLRKYQLNELILSEPDAMIGVRFVEDLCNDLQRQGFDRTALFKMGKHSAMANYDGPLGREFRALGNVKAAYESCFTEIISRYYDENFDYRLLSISAERCLVEARPSEKVKDALQVSVVGNTGTCYARCGTMASIPSYLRLPDSWVIEHQCIHRGDSRCLYEIGYEAAARAC